MFRAEREGGVVLPGVGDLALVAGGEGNGAEEEVIHVRHLVDVPQVHAGPGERRRLVKGAVQALNGGCVPRADVAVERRRPVKGAVQALDGGRYPFAEVAVERLDFAVGVADFVARLVAERGKGALEGRDAARIPVLDGAPLGGVRRRRVDDRPCRLRELTLGEGLCKGRGGEYGVNGGDEGREMECVGGVGNERKGGSEGEACVYARYARVR